MFAKRLRLLRTELGLTQKELADKLNIRNTAISKYELGEREPDIETLAFLSNLFDVSVDYLIGKSDERNHDKPSMTIKRYNLVEGVEELPQEAIDQIDEYIRLLKLKYKNENKGNN
ncbi:MAG: helix-turn-helix domain-containing protein [Tissierellales bacterium]|jgi:transcriptional regulator with XRE-family HTH domain|nr:helix-turn-helix domain-containing protein [Tissierellales bacterium]